MEVLHSASSFAENLKKLLEEPGKVLHPYAITTNGQFLYWTDWSKKSIHQWRITGQTIKSNEIHNKRTAIESIRDLHIYNSSRQIKGNIIVAFSVVYNLNVLDSLHFLSKLSFDAQDCEIFHFLPYFGKVSS